MTLIEALKWADTFGTYQSNPPTGDAPALQTLAAEVRRLEKKVEELKFPVAQPGGNLTFFTK